MIVFGNLDLFSLGLAIAATGILGFMVFFRNRRSITNKTFLFFVSVTVSWGIFNYLHYQVDSPQLALWFLRLVMFTAVWQSFFLFQLFYVFPEEKFNFSNRYKLLLVPLVVVVSIIALTPLLFSEITGLSESGVPETKKGPGIILFAILAVGLVVCGIVFLVKKVRMAKGEQKTQFRLVLWGTILTFSLIILFNFIFAAFLGNFRFIPLGAVFTFPFVIFTSYAIFKHHLLGIKVIVTEVLIFMLAVAILFEVVISETLTTRLLRSGIFLLVLAVGILLIRSVRQEVEQRERIEKFSRELALANRKLAEIDRVKSELLSFVSHQIRGPLTAIKGYGSLIIEGNYGSFPAKAKTAVANIVESTNKLIELATNFLDLRRIEEGKMEYQFSELDLVSLVKKISQEFSILAKRKNLKLVFESDIKETEIRADETRLRQVIQNVIDNAIKYTDKGEIDLSFSLKPSEKKVVLQVKDTGRGMSQEVLATIFDQFTRDPKMKNILGTGLGLYIAKGIVKAHQGRIWAESEGEGKGSTFYIELPMNG